MAKLSTILDQIDAGSMLLPEFQRGSCPPSTPLPAHHPADTP